MSRLRWRAWLSLFLLALTLLPAITGFAIVNNTFYGNGASVWGGIAVDNPELRNLVVRNNIVSQNLYLRRFRIASPSSGSG